MNFSHDKFDAEKYVDDQMQIMDERGVRLLVGDLADYRRVSADEMRKSVFANYTAFIGTSKEIAELEVELQQMKNLLSVQTALIHSLAADSMNNDNSNSASAGGGGGGSTPASTTSSVTTAGTSSTFAGASSYASSLATPQQDEEEDERIWSVEVPEPTEIEKYAEALPDILDILIAERKVDRAIELLEQGQQIVQLALATAGDGAGGGAGGGKGGGGHGGGGEDEEILSADAANALAAAIAERRAWLMAQLEETAQQAAVRGQELRQAVGALYRLGETERAHQLLLGAYGERIRSGSRLLRPRGTSFGGAYTAALAQLVFSAISQAATDSARIFASDPACAADLLLWAQRETEFCVSLLKRHVLSSAAAAGGLHAAAECVRIALGHCRLLEEQGLTLSPVLSKLVRPSVEEALEFNIIRIEDSVATMVAVDDWVLLPLPHGAAATGRVRALQQTLGPGLMHLRLSSSGQRFYLLLVDLVEDILPVISLQLFGRILDRLASLFESYVALLQKALPSPSDDDEEEDEGNGGEGGKGGEKGGEKENGEEPWQDGSVRTAEDEQQQLALLGNASALADDLLPRLAQRLTLAAGEEGGGGGGRGGRKQGGADPDRRLSAGGRYVLSLALNALNSLSLFGSGNMAEHKEWWRQRLQNAVDKRRDALCSCLAGGALNPSHNHPPFPLPPLLPLSPRLSLWQQRGGAQGVAEHKEWRRRLQKAVDKLRDVLCSNEHKEWRRRLQKAVDKLRDVLCSCLVAEFMYGHDGQPILTAHQYLHMDAKMRPTQWASQAPALASLPGKRVVSRPVGVSQVSVCQPILTAHQYLHMDAKMRPTQWALKPLPSPPFQALYMALHSIRSTAMYLWEGAVLGGRDRVALYMALHSIHSTATYVLGGRDRVVTLLLMRLAEWLMMGLMVYSSFWDELENAEYALGPTGLQQLVFDMYFVMQVAKAGKYSSRAMRKVAEDSATKAIVLFTDQTGGDPNSLLQEDWWYEHKCVEAIEELAAAASPAASPPAAPAGAGAAGGSTTAAALSPTIPALQQQGDAGLSQQQQGPGRSGLDEERRSAAKGQYDMYDDDGGGRSARPGGRGAASRSPTSESAGRGARNRGFSDDDYGSGGGRSEYSSRDRGDGREYGRDYGRERDSGGSREYGRERDGAGGWEYGRDGGGRDYRESGGRDYGRERDGSYRDRDVSYRERDRDGYGRDERGYGGRQPQRRGGY
ncbi:unnamed protein product [Closterium sp. NIES-64]|nr:unnamed protein product [Closterium sp. NIES-64]